jgi:HYR domain
MRLKAGWQGLLLLAVVAAATTTAPTGSTSPLAVNSLDLRATLSMASLGVECPAGPPPGADCRARTARGLIPGLGSVSETYTWFFTQGAPHCPPDLAKPRATAARLVVAGKGEIRFAISDGARCVDVEPVRNEPQEFTITGGTGPYQGASGGGRLERNVSLGRGTEWLTGTLVVPGLEFDVTPPTLSGAASKTVGAPKGAKRVRVTYNVTARDTVDSAVPVTCLPRSGSRFSLGRTTVKCEAMDKSANTARARFVVTVRAR